MEKRPIRSTKNKALVDAILANEAKFGMAQYKTAVEISQQIGCTPELVWRYRAVLKHKGLIDPAKAKQTALRGSPYAVNAHVETSVAASPSDDEPIPTELQRLRYMARLLRMGSPQVKIAAFRALNEATRGTEGKLGPPAPLTSDERVARMMRLMMAIGQDEVDRAYEAAFEDTSELQTGESEAPLQPDPTPLRETTPESTLSVPDLPPAEPPSGGPQPSDG